MARGIFIVSEQFKNLDNTLKQIKEFAEVNNYKFETEKSEYFNECTIYLEEKFQLEFNIVFENKFKRDGYLKNDSQYFVYIILNYYSGDLPYVNQFIKYFLELNPDMLVDDSDDSNRKFYSIEQINKKEAPQWLLE